VYAHAGRAGGARWLLVPLALAAGSLGGCAGFWDEVTSRDFHFQSLFQARPDPLWVIQNSPDGDKKAKALASLREPLPNGGTQEQQDLIVKVLVWSAAHDQQALCRLAAIDSLRSFRDPRAVEGLKEAYYNADMFPPDTAVAIKSQALAALGDTKQPAAVELLVKALREPPVEGSEVDKQQKMDERIAAARALGHFQNSQAAEALVAVLRGERDVALRNRAHESLVQVTGKDLPPDAQAWDEFLNSPAGKDALAHQPGVFDKFLRLVSWQADK
jgi:hypothetical protein